MDLAGDGQPDLVLLDGPTPGLYEHEDDEGWQPFRPFRPARARTAATRTCASSTWTATATPTA